MAAVVNEHRWSGWPGAWCLDCGIEDPFEIALADGDVVEVDDPEAPLGFRYDFPNVKLEPCPCPGEGRFDPYKKAAPGAGTTGGLS